MRYREFKLVEAEGDVVRVAVGDSHAVAIKRAGGFSGSPANGATVSQIANQVARVPTGAAVILSAGNNDINRAPGQVVDAVQGIVDALKARDCTVTLVLFPPIDLNGAYRAVYAQAGYTQNYNAVRSALSRVRCDGKLELNTGDINPQDSMKIHATNAAYSRIARAFELATGGADAAAQPASPEAVASGVPAGTETLSAEDLNAIEISHPDNSFFGLFNNLNAQINLSQEDLAAQIALQTGAGAATGAGTGAVAGSAGGSTAPSDIPAGAGGTGNARTALQFFIGKGLTPAQSAGIVGNLQAESGANLNPAAVGDGGQAIGIAQWHPDRRANFQRAFGKPFNQSTFQDQLNFIWWELNNTERNAMTRLRATRTAEEAAAVFDQYYERSSGAHRSRRIANAVALLTPATGTRVA